MKVLALLLVVLALTACGNKTTPITAKEPASIIGIWKITGTSTDGKADPAVPAGSETFTRITKDFTEYTSSGAPDWQSRVAYTFANGKLTATDRGKTITADMLVSGDGKSMTIEYNDGAKKQAANLVRASDDEIKTLPVQKD